jgi:uncharacterized protein (DUF488 family)
MRIHTIGYEGQTLASFLAKLRAAGIRRIADVRELPLSHKRGFSKTPLRTALAKAGIDYRHLRALGCPKDVRRRYRKDGDWAAYTRGFSAHLRRQAEAIRELADLAREEPTALLCFEADAARCHRHFIADAVAKLTRARVEHIESA